MPEEKRLVSDPTTTLVKKGYKSAKKVLFIGQLFCVGHCWATLRHNEDTAKELAKERPEVRDAIVKFQRSRHVENILAGRVITFSGNKI